MYESISIGIDQSYQRTGISVAVDGQLKIVRSLDLSKYKDNSTKRMKLQSYLHNMIQHLQPQAKVVYCTIERIRLFSNSFVNINYIKSIGALNAVIIDTFFKYNIGVYSVDTRAWKAQIIGSTKKQKNSFGVPEEKYLTVDWCIKHGFEESLLIEINGRKRKNTFVREDKRFEYDTDAADSAGISMFRYLGNVKNLELEK